MRDLTSKLPNRVAENYMNVATSQVWSTAWGVLGVPLVVVLGHINLEPSKQHLQYAKDQKPLPGHLYMMIDAVYPGVSGAIK